MTPAATALIMEGAKFALQIYFTNAKLAGKTDEEITTMFQAELAQFRKNRPEALPDV